MKNSKKFLLTFFLPSRTGAPTDVLSGGLLVLFLSPKRLLLRVSPPFGGKERERERESDLEKTKKKRKKRYDVRHSA